MPYLDSSAALADEWNQAAPTSPEQAAAFFRNSTAYLYNLAVWQASGHRPDYTSDGIPLLRAAGVRRVCDYGCGIGNDTLPLLDAGFAVTCCDYDSPSTNFLRWRLTRRGHHVPPILEPAELRDHPAPDALWVIDTLDHLADIDNAVGHLLDQVDLVITENLTTNRGTTNKGFHYHRRPDHITATFASHGLEPGPPQAGHTVVTAWVRPGASRLGHHPPSRAVQARADAWRPEPGAS